MKKLFKIASYVLITAFFSVALSGCGKQTTTNPNANKIVIWSFENEDTWKPLVKAFQSNNKGYTVTYKQETLDSGYENRVLNSILSGQGPDIWAMPNDWVYRHKDKLAPMPADIIKQSKIDMDNMFVPVIKNSVLFDNNIYALSPSAEPLMIYYNPDLIKKTADNLLKNSTNQDFNQKAGKYLYGSFPTKWDDFVEMAKLLTLKNGNQIVQSGAAMGSEKLTYAQDILYLLMYQNDTQIISSDYKIATFNLPAETATGTQDTPGKRALDFFTSFTNPSSPNYSWDDSLGSDIDAFGNGKTAMFFGYSSTQNILFQKYPNLSFKKAFVPQISVEPSEIKDYARFNAFGVNALSANTTVDWNIVVSLSTSIGSSFCSSTRLYTSTKANDYNISINNRYSGDPEKLSLATANSVVKGRFPTDFDNYIKNAIVSVRSGQKTQNSLDLAANSITDLLRKTDW